MFRLSFTTLVLIFTHSAVNAQGPAPLGKIVVDASKDGGFWWFPQGGGAFDKTKPHQGMRFAGYLKSCGWEVEEIPRGESVAGRFKNTAIVIRANFFGEYSDAEVSTYSEYISGGGSVLLMKGFVDGRTGDDKVAEKLGIFFAKTIRSPSIKKWASHPMTIGLQLLDYQIGSVVTRSPESTVPIAYLDNDEVVIGSVRIGKGKVVFMSFILPMLSVPQPFTERLLGELAPKTL